MWAPQHLNSAPSYSFSSSVPLQGPLLPHCQHRTPPPHTGSVGSEGGVCSLSTCQLVKGFGTLSGFI